MPYGTALSAAQLNASDGGGNLCLQRRLGTVLTAGSQTLSVTFTPTDQHVTTQRRQRRCTLTVNKATPAITWATPAAIPYGTALSATQLNASSTVLGRSSTRRQPEPV